MDKSIPASTPPLATNSSTAGGVISNGKNTRGNFRGHSLTAKLPYVTSRLTIEDVSGDPEYMDKARVVSKPDYVTFPKDGVMSEKSLKKIPVLKAMPLT